MLLRESHFGSNTSPFRFGPATMGPSLQVFWDMLDRPLGRDGQKVTLSYRHTTLGRSRPDTVIILNMAGYSHQPFSSHTKELGRAGQVNFLNHWAGPGTNRSFSGLHGSWSFDCKHYTPAPDITDRGFMCDERSATLDLIFSWRGKNGPQRHLKMNYEPVGDAWHGDVGVMAWKTVGGHLQQELEIHHVKMWLGEALNTADHNPNICQALAPPPPPPTALMLPPPPPGPAPSVQSSSSGPRAKAPPPPPPPGSDSYVERRPPNHAAFVQRRINNAPPSSSSGLQTMAPPTPPPATYSAWGQNIQMQIDDAARAPAALPPAQGAFPHCAVVAKAVACPASTPWITPAGLPPGATTSSRLAQSGAAVRVAMGEDPRNLVLDLDAAVRVAMGEDEYDDDNLRTSSYWSRMYRPGLYYGGPGYDSEGTHRPSTETSTVSTSAGEESSRMSGPAAQEGAAVTDWGAWSRECSDAEREEAAAAEAAEEGWVDWDAETVSGISGDGDAELFIC